MVDRLAGGPAGVCGVRQSCQSAPCLLAGDGRCLAALRWAKRRMAAISAGKLGATRAVQSTGHSRGRPRAFRDLPYWIRESTGVVR